MLRSVLLAQRGMPIGESLDVEDPRALRRLLASGGVADLRRRSLAVAEFLDLQRFVRSPELLLEVHRQGAWQRPKNDR